MAACVKILLENIKQNFISKCVFEFSANNGDESIIFTNICVDFSQHDTSFGQYTKFYNKK